MWRVKHAGYREWEDCETIAEVLEEVSFRLKQDVQCDLLIRKARNEESLQADMPADEVVEQNNKRVPKRAKSVKK